MRGNQSCPTQVSFKIHSLEIERPPASPAVQIQENLRMAVPPGVAALIASRGGRNFPQNAYRGAVLLITFGVYALYHATRKPPSIVKAVLVSSSSGPGWEPFNGSDGKSMLGSIDVTFLGSYAISMFFAGHLGDSLDLRMFLTVSFMIQFATGTDQFDTV